MLVFGAFIALSLPFMMGLVSIYQKLCIRLPRKHTRIQRVKWN